MSRNRWIARDSEGTVIPVWGAFNTLTDVDVISGPQNCRDSWIVRARVRVLKVLAEYIVVLLVRC